MISVVLVLVLGLVGPLAAVDCDKRMAYHGRYAYGIDIICEGLSDETQEMLKQISMDRQLLLNINNSNLTRVTPQLFSSLHKIRYLSITNSTFRFNENDAIFNELRLLEHLSVENTEFKVHPHVFRGLDKLIELKLTNNGIYLIKNTTFSMFSNLKTLKLSYNHLKSLFDVPFCELPNLKYLDLEGNEITQVVYFASCFDHASGPDIKLNGKNYKVKYKTDELYRQIKSQSNLIELNFSRNKISTLVSFDWATNLKHIDLSYNNLREIGENLFILLGDLEKLYLQHNLLHSIHDSAFVKLKSLKIVNLSNNSLANVTLRNLANLEVINLSQNKLTTASLKHFNNLPKIRQLVLSENKISRIGVDEFYSLSSLLLLDLADNNVVLDDNSFGNLVNLTILNLRNNSLTVIPSGSFSKLLKLEVLDISQNKLSTLDDSGLFKNLHKLRVLNMSHNLLDTLNYETVRPLSNLQILDVSGNLLQNFQFDLISLLPSLRVINIKSNLLPCSILYSIIAFFKDKHISYTIHEKFDYERKNIEGIYCEEVALKTVNTEDVDNRIRVSSALGILFIFIAFAVVFAFVFYKCLICSKRRRYTMDEVELI